MEAQNYDELKKLYEHEKNDKEMYRQSLYELYQTASYMLLKQDSVEPEKVRQQLEDIKVMIGTREGFYD